MVGIFSRLSGGEEAIDGRGLPWFLHISLCEEMTHWRWNIIILELFLETNSFINSKVRPCSDSSSVNLFEKVWDDRNRVVPNSEISTAVSVVMPHLFEAKFDFKPVDHPVEPHDDDLPVKCPAPEPSILNDARVWKERLSGNRLRRADLPVMKDEDPQVQREKTYTGHFIAPHQASFLPSLSVPERSIVKFLEESNAADGGQGSVSTVL